MVCSNMLHCTGPAIVTTAGCTEHTTVMMPLAAVGYFGLQQCAALHWQCIAVGVTIPVVHLVYIKEPALTMQLSTTAVAVVRPLWLSAQCHC
jgi:hypothetical protein